MTPSPACAAFIRGFEQCRLTAYKPTPDDVWTCGWGSTGPGITEGTHWTQAQADARFAADLAHFGAGVWGHITSPTTQGMFEALTSLAYNIGLGAFATSSLLSHHNRGDYVEAAERFISWNHQNGHVLAGLTRRREAEAAMYRGEKSGDKK